MKQRLLCFLMKNNHIYNVCDDNLLKKDKNCYIVTKYGSMAHPLIKYDKIIDRKVQEKNMYIGGYYELIDFLKINSIDRIYLRGFNRATIGRVFRLVIESNDNKLLEKDQVMVKKRKK